jgi:hypothetical protein
VLNLGINYIPVSKHDAYGATCSSSGASFSEGRKKGIGRYRLQWFGAFSGTKQHAPIPRVLVIVRIPSEFLSLRMERAFVPDQLSWSSAMIFGNKVPCAPRVLSADGTWNSPSSQAR